MSGGGASPTEKFAWVEIEDPSGGDSIVLIAANGTVKMPVAKNYYGKYEFLIAGRNGQVENTEPLEDYADDALCWQLAKIYGLINATFEPTGVGNEALVTVMGHTVSTRTEGVLVAASDIYGEVGFVEGVARITTPVGDVACVVKNGTLYPILTEYDQATEDNWTLQDVYLNGDNEVSNLQQMVDRSGAYLAYTEDQEADKWSPIENYLHIHVKMPIVPKIGFVPAQQVGLGNVLPGLNYAVTL